ncbi:DUF6011 domain-containing protein [Actinacidiphila sp. SB3-2]
MTAEPKPQVRAEAKPETTPEPAPGPATGVVPGTPDGSSSGSAPGTSPEGAAGDAPVPMPESELLPDSAPVTGRRVLCRMCGQPLRDRASRLWGLGPDCRHKLSLRTAPSPPQHEVDQDTLPGM